MANDDNSNPQGVSRRPEDNPFIMFRRFADSQVSSLLNTIFTLPATRANYNNAHQAREQCLFGKADMRQCEKLDQLEAESAELQREGRELFREGNVQGVLRNSDSMLRLEQEAEGIRREILQEAFRNGEIKPEGHDKVALVERVASQKGRDWGAEWDWGVPKPFDSDRDERGRNKEEWNTILRLHSEVQKLVAAFDGAAWDDPPTDAERRHNSSETNTNTSGSHERSWARLWQWPAPADQSRYSDGNYAPRALEADRQLGRSGVPWREAYEDLMRGEENSNQNHSRVEEPHDEPSYEYSHDHEDQHDEPSSPKTDHALANFRQVSHQAARIDVANENCYRNDDEGAETEMDAYEHFAAGYDRPSSSISRLLGNQYHGAANNTSSILSTLTTTERIVAPDGSVTTKVVLKKRFADGREESSESVHTQLGQGGGGVKSQISQKTLGQAQESSKEKPPKSSSGTRNSWFWSN